MRLWVFNVSLIKFFKSLGISEKKPDENLELSKREEDFKERDDLNIEVAKRREKNYKELDVEKIQIVATLDDCTCDICGNNDLKILSIDENQIGVNSPPFHLNCRCTTVPYIEDMQDWGGMRAARDENGKHINVSGKMTYSKWKKAIGQIRKHKILLEQGNITQEEFDKKKKRLLGI